MKFAIQSYKFHKSTRSVEKGVVIWSLRRVRPANFSAKFRPTQGLLGRFNGMVMFLVICRCDLEVVVAWASLDRLLWRDRAFSDAPPVKLQFSTWIIGEETVRSLNFPEIEKIGFLFINYLKIIFSIYYNYKNLFLISENSKNYYFNSKYYF